MPNLPAANRLRIGRYSEAGRIYLLTTTTHHRAPVFRDFVLGRLVVDQFRCAQGLGYANSLAWVVMPDHFHWLIELRQGSLSELMQRTKSLSAKAVKQATGRTTDLWHRGFYDQALRREEDLVKVARYVVANPLRAGLVGLGLEPKPAFRQALAQIWDEPVARRFTVFVFVSMIAFSAQDLILEPFAGTVFGFTPGESTRLSGVQNAGVLCGMLLVAAAGALGQRWAHRAGWRHVGSLRAWAVGGCISSALALGGLTLAGLQGPGWPLQANVFLLGLCNGAFSIGAIGSMMALASQGRHGREGVRMGLWGAAQAIGFALGGLLGTGAADLTRSLLADAGTAYAVVFAVEALAFLAAALLAARVSTVAAAPGPLPAAEPAPRRPDAFLVPQAAIGHHQRPAA